MSTALEHSFTSITGRRWAIRSTDLVSHPSLRERVRAGARSAFLASAGAVVRLPRQGVLRCIYAHGVFDDQVDSFRRLLRSLQSIGHFVDTDTVLRVGQRQEHVTAPCFHLSFDDGFDNNRRNVLPILEELGIRATFFVPTRLVGATDDFLRNHWWAPEQVLTRTMDWAAVRELHDAGHEIGSHTQTHARLSEISADQKQLRAEIWDSKREIEDAIGAPCKYIAWPYGRSDDVDDRALAEVRAAGYSGCFSAVRGYVAPGDTNLWRIPRHHFEADWPWLHVRYFAAGGRERNP